MKNTMYRMIALFLAGILLCAGVAFLLPRISGGSDIVADSEGPEQPPPEEPENDANETEEELPEDEAPPADAPADEPEPEPEPVIETAPYVLAKVDSLQVRSGPGTGHTSLGHINAGDMVTLVGRSGDWYITRYKNRTAYISAAADYTELRELEKHYSQAVEDVIEEGLRLLGFPYVYGATRYHDGSGRKLIGFDATKFDCSSLVQYIFHRGAAINLHMTTRTQVKQGSYVPRSKIERGDLIFFTNAQRYNKTGVERIGHVALYLGDNYILHTASDYAVIEQISAQRWRYYIETRRLF